MLQRKHLFSDTEAGGLRRVYMLALSALRHTHLVTGTTERHLADAVFDAYIAVNCPTFPLPVDLVEDLAIASIEVMIETHGEPTFRVRRKSI